MISTKRLSRWSSILTLLLSLVILFEYQSAPLQSQYIDYDKSVFEQLAQETGDFAILNLPLRYRFSKEYLYEQTLHQRPILQGHVSREPHNLYRFIEQNEWLSTLPELVADPGYVMAQLSEANVGYVVLSKYLLEDSVWRLWKRHMPYAPYYSDDRYLVYATTPEYGRDLKPPIEAAPGLGSVESSLAAFCSTEQIVAVAAITWATTAPLQSDYAVQLSALSNETGEEVLTSLVPLVDAWPTSQWPAGTVVRHAYALTLPAEASSSTIALRLFDQQNGTPLGDPLFEEQIDSALCTIDAGAAAEANILFGDSLRLLAYDIGLEEDNLSVTLYWLGQERPLDAYKFFIHVYDPRTKEIVAQIDTMPLNYQLPTSDWQSGELVTDEINLSLAGVSPGEYELGIGVYNPETGERLPLSTMTKPLQISDDGRLLLPDLVRIPQE